MSENKDLPLPLPPHMQEVVRHIVDTHPELGQFVVALSTMPAKTSTRQIIKTMGVPRKIGADIIAELTELGILVEKEHQDGTTPYRYPEFTVKGRRIADAFEIAFEKETLKRQTIAVDIDKVTHENVNNYFERFFILRDEELMSPERINHIFCLDVANGKIDVNDTELVEKGLSYMYNLGKEKSGFIEPYNARQKAVELKEIFTAWKKKHEGMITISQDTLNKISKLISKLTIVSDDYQLTKDEESQIAEVMNAEMDKNPELAKQNLKGVKFKIPLPNGKSWIATVRRNENTTLPTEIDWTIQEKSYVMPPELRIKVNDGAIVKGSVKLNDDSTLAKASDNELIVEPDVVEQETPALAPMPEVEPVISDKHKLVEDVLLAASPDTPEARHKLAQRVKDYPVAELRMLGVIELLMRGKRVKFIAKDMDLTEQAVYNLIARIKEQAQGELKAFFTDIIPLQVKLQLERLNDDIGFFIEMSENESLSAKERMDARSRAQESSMRILGMLTEDRSFLSTISNAIRNNTKEELR